MFRFSGLSLFDSLRGDEGYDAVRTGYTSVLRITGS